MNQAALKVVAILYATMFLGVQTALSAPVLPLPCEEAEDGEVTIFSPAASAEVTGWVPNCVRVQNGDTITFTNLDAVFHVPFAQGCFDLGNVNAGQSRSVSLYYDDVLALAEDGDEAPRLWTSTNPLLGWVPCEMDAKQQREGAVPFGSRGDALPTIEIGDDRVTIHFICEFHGAAMKGVIEIML